MLWTWCSIKDNAIDKLRFIPLHLCTEECINAYLQAAGHAGDTWGALFNLIENNVHGNQRVSVTADGIYQMLAGYMARRLGGYAANLKMDVAGFVPHPLWTRCLGRAGMPW